MKAIKVESCDVCKNVNFCRTLNYSKCPLHDWPSVSKKEIVETWPKSHWAKDEIRRFIDWLQSKGVIIKDEKDGH